MIISIDTRILYTGYYAYTKKYEQNNLCPISISRTEPYYLSNIKKYPV